MVVVVMMMMLMKSRKSHLVLVFFVVALMIHHLGGRSPEEFPLGWLLGSSESRSMPRLDVHIESLG